MRGANGVILITTKRGSKGAPKFNMNYTFTLQQPTRLPTFLGSYDHAVLRNESLANDGARPAFTEEDIEHYRLGDSPYTHPDNDYVKDFLRKFDLLDDVRNAPDVLPLPASRRFLRRQHG